LKKYDRRDDLEKLAETSARPAFDFLFPRRLRGAVVAARSVFCFTFCPMRAAPRPMRYKMRPDIKAARAEKI
jgi:hypothetical protein